MVTAHLFVIRETGPALQDIRRVLFKFTLLNPTHIIHGMPLQLNRLSVVQKDALMAAIAKEHGQVDRAAVGRVREGRVDTGTEVLKTHMIRASTIRSGLANNGYVMTNTWTIKHPKHGRPVITLEYFKDRPDLKPAEFESGAERGVIEGVRELAGMVWQYCNVWKNPDGTVTINLSHPQKDGTKPDYNLVINRGELGLEVPEDNPLSEVEAADRRRR